MSKTAKGILGFFLVMVAVFGALSVLNKKKALNIIDLQRSVAQMETMDELLRQPKVDWDQVESLYDGSLKKLVRDTKRFATNSYLHGKITDAITEGSKGYVDAISAIVLRRTWLRICLFHVGALMDPQTEQEQALTLEERIARVRLLADPVYQFAAEAEPGREDNSQAVLRQRIAAWEANPGAETAEAFDQAMAGLLARAILHRLSQWRREDVQQRDAFQRALTLQAEMRQLYHPIYDGLYGVIGREAWTVLTEFTNRPTDMDAALVETVLTKNLATEMAIFD